jgi:hypothetical protein
MNLMRKYDMEMNNKIDIVAKFIEEDYGTDYFDRYLRPAEVYVYIFENSRKERFVWQSRVRCKLKLFEGHIYHLKALQGDRLLGGRGQNINEVEILGVMNTIEVETFGEKSESEIPGRWIN